jgi:pullulanase/glycogen debranching enzyme
MKTKILYFISIFILANFTMGAELFIKDKNESNLTLKQFKYLKKLDELDNFYSTKPLGSFVENGKTIFRLFAPQAVKTYVIIYKNPTDTPLITTPMSKDSNGVWEATLNIELYEHYYGYKVFNEDENENSDKPIIVDPYAKAVTQLNTYFSPRLGLIIKENNYNWEGDEWIQQDWRDLIIYEMHIRDMTAHNSSGAKKPGTYKGLIEKGIKGGINYIKKMGINAIELLPIQEYADIEIPYQKELKGKRNTWNPYERNHWGYMTSSFFAPESYYSEGEIKWNEWSGKTGKQVKDFKDIVKAFHKEGIAVIMDVVYNHLSEYESGNLKDIDKEYYFRLDKNGNYIAQSGCGNDLKTERPMLRRMIVESILYWMKEYHIDGFRFDLGKLIDWETIEEIIYQAQKINPYVIFVCEPWGGGYDPAGFSLRGWGSWNDQIRNGIKGENPFNGLGWIFNKWYGNNNTQRIKSYVNGTLVRDSLGLFQKKEHSVNYLEAHDGYTLGDFIRIATKEIDTSKIIHNTDEVIKLTPLQLKLNKLAALFLFSSQGIIMIHSGQEFARTKVIPLNIETPDGHKGKIDHNTYDKDNEVNYINYAHSEINKELLNYYKGLIQLRNEYEAFRRADYEDIIFYNIRDNEFALGYRIKYLKDEFLVLLNANLSQAEEFILPEGEWKILVNPVTAGIKPLKSIKEKIIIEQSSGYILMKK